MLPRRLQTYITHSTSGQKNDEECVLLHGGRNCHGGGPARVWHCHVAVILGSGCFPPSARARFGSVPRFGGLPSTGHTTGPHPSSCCCVRSATIPPVAERVGFSPTGTAPDGPSVCTEPRQHKSAISHNDGEIHDISFHNHNKTYRAASEFSTKLRAAVLFGAFRFSAPPPPPETAGYVSDSPRTETA